MLSKEVRYQLQDMYGCGCFPDSVIDAIFESEPIHETELNAAIAFTAANEPFYSELHLYLTKTPIFVIPA